MMDRKKNRVCQNTKLQELKLKEMYYRKCGEFALVEEHLVLRFGLDPKLRAAAKISFKNCKLLNVVWPKCCRAPRADAHGTIEILT